MDIETFREFCLSLPGTTEGMPFDDRVLVFKVMGKIFALTDIEDFGFINLKCDPEKATELREKHPETVKPGYHMNKVHWNSVVPNAALSDKELYYWTRHSYELIASKLPKKLKNELKALS